MAAAQVARLVTTRDFLKKARHFSVKKNCPETSLRQRTSASQRQDRSFELQFGVGMLNSQPRTPVFQPEPNRRAAEGVARELAVPAKSPHPTDGGFKTVAGGLPNRRRICADEVMSARLNSRALRPAPRVPYSGSTLGTISGLRL